MQGRITEKLVAGLLILFLLIYVGFQTFRFFGSPVKTETVYEYTVAQAITTKGVILRDEQVLSEAGSGVMSCLFEDGERVLVGAPVVEYLASEGVGADRSRLRDTQWEIAMLKEAQNTSLSHFSNAEALGRDIKQQMSQLVYMASLGQYDQLPAVQSNLVSLLNKRQIATGKENSFQLRIDQLTAEQDDLTTATGRQVNNVVKAPVSGYYAKPLDGYESLLNTKMATEGSLRELTELVETAEKPLHGAPGSGRIVTNQNWYVVITADKYEIQWVRSGQSLQLIFEGVSAKVPATVHRVLTANDSDNAVLVIHCNYITGELLDLRAEEVRLEFSQYTGLWVDTANLRFNGDERGVYVLENNVVRFKKLDPIYEEAGFVLSQQPYDLYNTEYLRQFDQIITKGTELEDGKIFD